MKHAAVFQVLDGDVVPKVLTLRLQPFDLIADKADEFVLEKHLREAEFLLAVGYQFVLVLEALANIDFTFFLLKAGEVDRFHALGQLDF